MTRSYSAFPWATIVGILIGIPATLFAVLASIAGFEDRVMVPFVAPALIVLLAAWIDWRRLWRPSSSVARASFALLVLSLLAAPLSAVMSGSDLLFALAGAPLAVALLLPIAAACIHSLGWRIVSGVVRREESDRLVLDTSEGVVEIDRDASQLGVRRSVRIEIGSCVSVVARPLRLGLGADPFRSEQRSMAASVLAAAEHPCAARAALQRRARAWSAYLIGLSIVIFALGTAVGYRL